MHQDLQKYIFVPLDLPVIKIDRERFCDYYDQNKFPFATVSKDYDRHNNWFALYAKTGQSWNQELCEMFPDFLSVLQNLPFVNTTICILEQFNPVLPHKDSNRAWEGHLGPSSFRYPIIIDEPERTFYFLKDDEPNVEIYPTWPPNHSRWFSMNQHISLHGSHMPSSGKRKLMLCVWGFINKPAMVELISHSIDKYKDYCICE